MMVTQLSSRDAVTTTTVSVRLKRRCSATSSSASGRAAHRTYERQHLVDLQQLARAAIRRESSSPCADEPDRPVLVQEVLRQRGADRDGVLLDRLDAAAGHHPLVQVQHQPDIGERIELELLHHQLSLPGRRCVQ